MIAYKQSICEITKLFVTAGSVICNSLDRIVTANIVYMEEYTLGYLTHWGRDMMVAITTDDNLKCIFLN